MNNFGHLEAMKVIFSSKCSSVYVDFENTRKLPENADSLEIIAFELVVGVFLNYDKDTCDGSSTC